MVRENGACGLRASFRWRRAVAAGKAIGGDDDGPGAGGEMDCLIALLADEISAISSQCDIAWRKEVAGAPVAPKLVLEQGAFRVRARISAGARAAPVIKVAIGTQLAIDDLALYAACAPLFLASDVVQLRRWACDLSGRRASFDLAGAREGQAPGFRDYAALARGPSCLRERIVFALPKAFWRLTDACLVSELMAAFVMLHERAHFALGHLDALGDIDTSPLQAGLGAIETETHAAWQRCVVRVQDRRLFELEADAMAFFVLSAYAQSACARFGEDQRLRFCLSAAMLACFLFHLSVNPDPLRRDPSYPSPQARMMHLMMCALSLVPARLSGQVRSRGAHCAPMSQLLALTLHDLSAVSDLYGGELSPLAAGENELRPAAWVRDVAALCASPRGSCRVLETEAGREIAALTPRARRWRTPLQALQRARFGEATRLRLSGQGMGRT